MTAAQDVSSSTLKRLKSSAQGAATVRAIAHREVDSKIRNPDYLAIHLIDTPPDESVTADIFRNHLENILPGAYHFQNARTHYIDTLMRRAITDGFEQIVLLGAGFDSRAYRLADDKYPNVRFFEVDQAALQTEKIEKIKCYFGRIPQQVSFVPIDFNTQSLATQLLTTDYDPTKKTFFNWEGVSYYLTAEGVSNTLNSISQHCAKGSRLLFDYMPQTMIAGSMDFYGGKESRQYMANSGEPVIFGINEAEIATFLSDHGFELSSNIGPDELARQHLITNNGEIHGRVSGYVRIAQATAN